MHPDSTPFSATGLQFAGTGVMQYQTSKQGSVLYMKVPKQERWLSSTTARPLLIRSVVLTNPCLC